MHPEGVMRAISFGEFRSSEIPLLWYQ